MADAVTSQTLVDGHQTAVLKFTNISDGSGESAVKKVDVSALATNVRGEARPSPTMIVILHGLSQRSRVIREG